MEVVPRIKRRAGFEGRLHPMIRKAYINSNDW
jgi:hypothetical protein